MWCQMVKNLTLCKMIVDSLPGWNGKRDGHKFNSTLQDDGQLTPWIQYHCRWSEIQEHLVREWLTHQLDKKWCRMVRNLNNTLQDDGLLTNWTKCDVRWSEIQQNLARQWLTHQLDKMWCRMVRNSTTLCKAMIDSPTEQNVMWDGQKFNNVLQDNRQLTNWTTYQARWSEIQQHTARRQSTHQLDQMSCKMVRNSTISCKMMVHSPTGQHIMQDGQKFNNTLWNNSPLTNWTKCHARWSEIQQHLVTGWSTHKLDSMSCEMVRNSTTPCRMAVGSQTGQNVLWDGQKFDNTLKDDSWLTNWTK